VKSADSHPPPPPEIPARDEYTSWAGWYDLTVGGHAPLIAFYGTLIQPETRSLLDLGCGTGAIAIALARHLHGTDRQPKARVAGVDRSPEMLRIARERAEHLEWALGDIRRPPVNGPFDLIISSYNVLQSLLTDADLEQALRAARRLLAADGTVAFDIYQPNERYLSSPHTDRLARSITDSRGVRLEVREDTRYDPADRILTVEWRLLREGETGGPPLAQTQYRMRQYPAAEVDRLLAAAGLRVRERYGDLDRSPFTAGSRKQVIVCGQG
jgi:ubiquinone/menaquinone biosynthesis C-methylase UbiE